MVSDQEPRYRLVDSDGNIVGSLYGKPDGSVAIQETASGADREVALAPDGTFSAPSVETPSLSAGVLDSTSPKNMGGRVYADSYDSLTDAIDDADAGSVVYLTPGEFYGDLGTINKTICLMGTGFYDGGSSTGPRIGSAEFTKRVFLRYVRYAGDIHINGETLNQVESCYQESGSLTVSEDRTSVIGCDGLDLTFATGTSGGLAIGNTNSTITDSGDNAIPAGSNT